jgi:hypothetical protein
LEFRVPALAICGTEAVALAPDNAALESQVGAQESIENGAFFVLIFALVFGLGFLNPM